ncbi:expressed unknown protein [Seminavis robusta]|uniref:Uncharacterized protein n=1 Tax=Seminavis robusta TaxID=568900 RepID=A0A9N8HAQ1_9STRA|nr:expressed unknown protein [Seminavis robusta]|eukprot:Sro156_g070810.1 n/a (504) ;mRNA; r:49430-50941
MAMSRADVDDDDEEMMVRTISVADYLQQVMDAVGPYKMIVTEQHRKSMIRCLMGFSKKGDFEVALQNLHMEWQWEQTHRFVQQDLSNISVDTTLAPMFQQGIQLPQQDIKSFRYRKQQGGGKESNPQQQQQQTYTSPHKFFSYLARGRTYQGKLERLLSDVAPQLIETYHKIIQEPNELELMKRLVLKETCNEQQSSSKEEEVHANTALQWKDALLELVEREFAVVPSPPPQIEDGGKRLGRQGEIDLSTYLHEQCNNQNDDDSSLLVLPNVLVKPTEKHLRQSKQQNNSSKRLPHVMSSNVNLMGLTSEFDAMVVQQQQQQHDMIQIVQLWEAKASIHPISISDVLFKKLRALQLILNDPSTRMYVYDKELKRRLLLQQQQNGDKKKLDHQNTTCSEDDPLVFSVLNNSVKKDHDTSSSSSDTPLLRLGIFGMELMEPERAARRAQYIHCERLLERNPAVVLQALSTGIVSAPDVNPHLQAMMDCARRLQATLVVLPSSSPA